MVKPITKATRAPRAPENETARERFVRVATLRVTNAVKSIELIEGVGYSQEYEFTREDAQKIITALNVSITKVTKALYERKAAKQVTGLFE